MQLQNIIPLLLLSPQKMFFNWMFCSLQMSPITPFSRNFYGVKSVWCPAFTLVMVRIYPKLPANSRTQKITNLFCWDNRKPLKNGWWEPGWSSLSLKCLKTFLEKSAYIKSKGLYKMSHFYPAWHFRYSKRNLVFSIVLTLAQS